MSRTLIELARKQGMHVLVAEVVSDKTDVVKAFETLGFRQKAVLERPLHDARRRVPWTSCSSLCRSAQRPTSFNRVASPSIRALSGQDVRQCQACMGLRA